MDSGPFLDQSSLQITLLPRHVNNTPPVFIGTCCGKFYPSNSPSLCTNGFTIRNKCFIWYILHHQVLSISIARKSFVHKFAHQKRITTASILIKKKKQVSVDWGLTIMRLFHIFYCCDQINFDGGKFMEWKCEASGIGLKGNVIMCKVLQCSSKGHMDMYYYSYCCSASVAVTETMGNASDLCV